MNLNSSLQTGITVFENVLIMYRRVRRGPRRWEQTVYSNGNALGQFVSICPHKRWYSTELVELQILGTEGPFGNVGVNDLQVKLICLGDGSNGCGATIVLPKSC